MKRLFRYEDPIYRRDTFVLLGASPRRVVRTCKLLFGVDVEEPEDVNASVYRFTHPELAQSFLVTFLESDPSVGTVAHEALHLVENTLWHCGIGHTKETREVWAYLLGFHVRSIGSIVARANRP